MAAHEAWSEGQIELDLYRLVFIDETVAATNMERRYGLVPRGERCHIAVPHGHYKIITVTVTAARRASGPFAISLTDSGTSGALRPSDTLLMDNLGPHEVAGVRQAIQAAGAHLRYLPASRPIFNPIEQAFAKLKAFLPTTAVRTVSDLWAAIRQAFTRFTAAECRNYLKAAGYDAYNSF